MAYQPERRKDQAAGFLTVKMGRPVTVTNLTRLSSGHSRETLIVETDLPNHADFVFRIEQGGVLGTASEPEFRLLQTLYGGPVPVPRVLWLEDDTRWFGYPFMVSERVEGDGGVGYLQDPAQKPQVLSAYIQAIAHMHSHSPTSLGLDYLGIPKDTQEATLRQIGFWAGVYEKYRFACEPLLDEAILWLRKNVPQSRREVALIHGDLGAGNFILQDGKIAALLDWEWSNIGDPMEDVAFLAYIKGRAFGPPEETIDLFRQHSHFGFTESELHYWEVFNYVKGCCSNIATLKVFCEGRNYGLNMVAIGTGGFLGFALRAAEALRRTPRR